MPSAPNNPLREDVSALLDARRELGPDYDRATVEALLERIGGEVDRRVDIRLAAYGHQPQQRRERTGLDFWTVVLALGSFGIAIGAPGAAGDHMGPGATLLVSLIAWTAILAVNVAHAMARRRPPS